MVQRTGKQHKTLHVGQSNINITQRIALIYRRKAGRYSKLVSCYYRPIYCILCAMILNTDFGAI